MNISYRHYWLYVLKLEQGKYYVGVTSKTPEIRMKEHENNFLAAGWTKQYRPVELIDKVDLGQMTYERAEAYENKVVRRYMKKYGYNNVRGGDLSLTEKYYKFWRWLAPEEAWIMIAAGLLLLAAAAYFIHNQFFK